MSANLNILKNMKKDFAKRHKLTMAKLNSFRWHEVSTKPEYKEILPDFNQFRLMFVQTLLKYAIETAKCPDCILTIAGSVSMTSDYDATVNSFATFGRVAEIFNIEFEKMWDGVTSAEIFDTNIYAIGYFMELDNQNLKLPKAFSTFTYLSPKNKKSQKFAYLKCLKGIKNCKEDLKNQTDLALMQLIKLHKLYGDNFKRKDILKSGISFPNYEKYEKMLNKRLEGVNVKNLKAMNKKYIEKVNAIQKYYKKTKLWKSLDIAKYKDMIGHAMIFGNETYFTQGAFFHVVGVLQIQIPTLSKIITRNELIHSVIENYAYLYMEYQQARDKYYFIALSAKYLIRILDAIERINVTPNKYSELKELLGKAKGSRRKVQHTFGDTFLIKSVMKDLEIEDEPQKDDMFEIMVGLTNFINKYLEDDFPFIVTGGDKITGFDFTLDQEDDEISSGDLSVDVAETRKSLSQGDPRSSIRRSKHSIFTPSPKYEGGRKKRKVKKIKKNKKIKKIKKKKK